MTKGSGARQTRLKVGLVGANWGATHIAAWRRVPGVEVAAICTSRRETAETAAEKYGIPRAYGDAAAMLADPDLDIIDVTPRPSIRVPIVMAALRAGRHVLQPLPFALSLAQGAHLMECARDRAVVAMVESLHRYAPAFRQAKAMVEEGVIGELHTIRGHVRTGILLDPPPGYVYGWIIDEENGASALRNFGAHLLHTLMWIFGDVEEVASRLTTRLPHIVFTDGSTKPNAVVDNASVLLQFANGAVGELDVSWTEPGADGFLIDAVGARGRLVLRADRLGPQNARLELAARNDATLREVAIEQRFGRLPDGSIHEEGISSRAFAMACMCHCMAEAVRAGNPAAAQPDFAEALRVMRVIEAAYLASQERRWVEVDEMH